MVDLSVANATSYLASRTGVPPGPWKARRLGGGVSNTVLLVESSSARFVIKQSLAKLRVKEDWFADRTRIHREAAAMRALAPHLPPRTVPAVLFEDRENCLYAMEAAPADATDWKLSLLRGDVRVRTAETAATILAAQISATARQPWWQREFGDQTCFDQLRLDPYYRFTAARYPDLVEFFARSIQSSTVNACALTHGDFSPKNLLEFNGSVMVIDFEVVHYGDPSFDAAFLLNHLLLKSIHRPERKSLYAESAAAFWHTLKARLPAGFEWFEQSTIQHLGCLHLARVDGKSPAEYLTREGKQIARRVARSILLDPPDEVLQTFDRP